MTKKELLQIIKKSAREKAKTLDFSRKNIKELPPEIGQLTNLTSLYLHDNQLTTVPPEVGQLTNLKTLDLSHNQLTTVPSEIGGLTNLTSLDIDNNQLTTMPSEIGKLTKLMRFDLDNNKLTGIALEIVQLTNLETLYLSGNRLTSVPSEIGKLTKLTSLDLYGNQLTTVPPEIGRLAKLTELSLNNNPLNPTLHSAFESGLDALRSYLLSLEETERREALYEAKLVLVGEGKVGKTTLLKALMNREGEKPTDDEPTTHGVNIDIQALHLSHPNKDDVVIQFNAWDFGGQEVYRVTHQFFFSRHAIYLLVWEPRAGVQQCQVEDWLKLIRLRVGEDARVIIISSHCRTGQRIARIDKPVFLRDYGSMIVGFHEVDSLVPDAETDEMVGVSELKELIAETAQGLQQMGTKFNRNWREARDAMLARAEPHISYHTFTEICAEHGLDETAALTLAKMMHSLGYIVFYSDDERLKGDVVLQPEWMTKAIGFVLEDRITEEMDGILPDSRLKEVWWEKPADEKTRYESSLYPFFIRLMEKYNVSYRLEDGNASLVAQHVPQVRPDLPWLPEEAPANKLRRLAMICVMEGIPPGIVPWMIVRTHEHACEQRCNDGSIHRLHWQKGMFLNNIGHGEAYLELRGREFHVYTEAVWPVFFMTVIKGILTRLITDNWPGMKDGYYFAVPCREKVTGQMCDGRFDIEALRQFLNEGDATIRCQVCRQRQDIIELLYGFEEHKLDEQLQRIEEKVDGLDSHIANYVMAIMHAMANEAKQGPRLFTIEPVDGYWRQLVMKRYRFQLWCEAEGCQHPVLEEGKGVYEFKVLSERIGRILPYANIIAGVLKTLLPIAAPAANLFFDAKVINESGIKDHLDLMKESTGKLLQGDLEIHEPMKMKDGVLKGTERSGILELHTVLRGEDPNHEKLGLKRMPTYSGDYLWLCDKHYKEAQPKIPEKIE